MSVVSRKLRSIPVRSAADTWKAAAFLLAPVETSDAHKELTSVSGIASSLISSEAMAEAGVVCTGSGPRVRIYCLHDEDAITGEEANESPLQHCPTEDEDWQVSLPCPSEDLDWVRRALKEKSNRISPRDMTERLGPQEENNGNPALASAQVNKEAFLRS